MNTPPRLEELSIASAAEATASNRASRRRKVTCGNAPKRGGKRNGVMRISSSNSEQSAVEKREGVPRIDLLY
jgi:hypothetical protein